jgi:hypothetical protein
MTTYIQRDFNSPHDYHACCIVHQLDAYTSSWYKSPLQRKLVMTCYLRIWLLQHSRHSHKFEVSSGMLVAPGLPERAEREFVTEVQVPLRHDRYYHWSAHLRLCLTHRHGAVQNSSELVTAVFVLAGMYFLYYRACMVRLFILGRLTGIHSCQWAHLS